MLLCNCYDSNNNNSSVKVFSSEIVKVESLDLYTEHFDFHTGHSAVYFF